MYKFIIIVSIVLLCAHYAQQPSNAFGNVGLCTYMYVDNNVLLMPYMPLNLLAADFNLLLAL